MKGLLGKFIDGGLFFTVPILIFLLVIFGLFIWGLFKKKVSNKIISLTKHFGWLAVAWGFLGRTVGLISAFNLVAAQGELTPRLLAEGAKMALVDPFFGIFVFIIARAGIIILTAIKKTDIIASN